MKEHNKNLALRIVLGILCVVVAGLIVGIIVMLVTKDSPSEDEVSFGKIRDAFESCNSVKAGYIVSGEKTYDQVVAELEAEALKGDEDYYVDYLTCYAQFVFLYGNGFSAVKEIMNRVDNNMLSRVAFLTRSGYYYTYGYFYEEMGDTGRAEYYNKLGAQGPNVEVVTGGD